MNIEIKLIIIALDFKTNNLMCLMVDEDCLIKKMLDLDYNIASLLKNHLQLYLDSNTDWISVKLVDVESKIDRISILYACKIPMMISNKCGKWVKIEDIKNEEIKETIFKAVRKVLSE